jgi:predicted amidohydrolase YtcJ
VIKSAVIESARTASHVVATGTLLSCLACAGPAEDGDNDVHLYVNARIVTMNPDQPTAEAMAVRNGQIMAIGDEEAVRTAAGREYKYYDLDGATVVPGFIETHEHMMMQGGVLGWADLSPATTRNRDEALAKLRRQDPDETGWILGFGMDPLLFAGEDGRPTWRESLDAVSREMPVFVIHGSGHGAYANTKAFELAGITKETAAPMGGEFVKNDRGDLEGFVKGRPAWLMIRGFPPVTRETTRHAADVRIT